MNTELLNELETFVKLCADAHADPEAILQTLIKGGCEPTTKEVTDLLQKQPNPEDDQVHQWAEAHGYEPDAVETKIYQLATQMVSFLEEGKAKAKGLTVKDVPKDEAAKGVQVESEHTSDPAIKQKIMLDHEVESDKYYKGLKDMEKKLEAK